MNISAMVKDSSHQDLAHYFNNTAMEWQMTPTKKRLFLVSTVDGNYFHGTYLTREGEWKEKRIGLKNWWDTLQAMPLKPSSFNLSNGCCLWYPNLSRNLKKSFPWSTNSCIFLGEKKPEEATTQNIGLRAFAQLYPAHKTIGLFTLPEALEFKDRKATLTAEGFVVNRSNNRLMYKKSTIAKLLDNRIILGPKTAVFKDFLAASGADPKCIHIELPPKEEEPKKKKIITDPVEAAMANPDTNYIDVRQNQNFMEGVFAMGIGVPSFYLYRQDGPGVMYRTYRGLYPGNEYLPAGWFFHSSTNQVQL